MSRAAALEKMRRARQLMAEAERELEAAEDDRPSAVVKVDDEEVKARARRALRRAGVAV